MNLIKLYPASLNRIKVNIAVDFSFFLEALKSVFCDEPYQFIIALLPSLFTSGYTINNEYCDDIKHYLYHNLIISRRRQNV